MINSPPLHAVRVFTVAARLLSFKAAAAELCVTAGAVSRQIQSLEEHLGVKLFDRRYREVVLSQMGELYLSQVGGALGAIDRASRRIRALTQRAPVHIDSTPTFAMYWLIPRLATFQALHPKIEVRLSTSQGPIDASRDADLFIRRDPAHFSGLPGETFMTEWSSLVCSPRFPGWQQLTSAKAVAGSQLISMRSRPDLWPLWFRSNGVDQAGSTRRIELDNTILAIQAALEGLGVAFVPHLFLSGLLESGALVCLPATQRVATGAYHVLQAAPVRSAEVELFADWLKGAAGIE